MIRNMMTAADMNKKNPTPATGTSDKPTGSSTIGRSTMQRNDEGNYI